ncbi:MAG TPA: RNA polymerase factor sigma-32 [Methylomirabilota bacterium]|jgi:RNA polymerase sigma-32 factor|nr:RNA polymerase factor sigma-32 [Methylomirabilota bacterium]
MSDAKSAPLDFSLPEVDLPKLIDDDDKAAESKNRALVPYDPLQRYLAEIRRFPLLSREEEHELAVRYKEYGDIQAAYKLVTSNLRLVVMIAREYQKAFKNLLDLIQEGNMGLMEAIKNFDPYRGVRFPSYAVWWIRAYMIRYIMNDWRMVKIGTTQAQRKLFFNLQKEKDRLEAEGLTPGPKLLAERLNVKEDEVVEMQQRLGSRDLSVDVPIGEGDEATLLNFLQDSRQTPEEQIAETQYQALLRHKMEQFANTLKDKELVIYRERLLNEEPLTLREIGEKYGISRERVRQIEERVKKKLKSYLNKELKDVIDISRAD